MLVACGDYWLPVADVQPAMYPMYLERIAQTSRQLPHATVREFW